MGTTVRVGSVFVVVALATALAACARNDNPETAGYWLDRLDKREERSEALKKLGRIGDKKAVPQVLKWLEKEGDWQPDAAYALGQLGDRTAVPRLVALLSFANAAPTDAHARHANRLNISIVRALVMLGATDQASSIKRLLTASDDRVREAALHALGDMGDPANATTLADYALNDREPPLVRLAAIQSLGDLRDAKATPALIQLLFTETTDGISYYEPARFALLRIGAGAVPELVRTLRRQNTAIEEFKLPNGQPLPEGAIEARVGTALGTLRATDAAEPIAAALAKMYERTRKPGAPQQVYHAVVELANALGDIGGARAVTALLPITRDNEVGLRIAACEALTTIGDHAVAPQLMAAAKTGSSPARAAAITAASRLASGDDLATFDALAKADPKQKDPSMKEMVEGERSRIVAAAECGAKVACWKKKTLDNDANVRERAAYELGWLGSRDAVSELLNAATDMNVEVRMAAVLSLSRVGGAELPKLESIYEQSKDHSEYAGVNAELLKLIERTKTATKK
jgi:HEAT repeat protein